MCQNIFRVLPVYFEQVKKPPDGHIGPYNNLGTHQGCALPSPLCRWDRLQHPSRDPERDAEINGSNHSRERSGSKPLCPCSNPIMGWRIVTRRKSSTSREGGSEPAEPPCWGSLNETTALVGLLGCWWKLAMRWRSRDRKLKKWLGFMQDWLVKDRQGWQREISPGVSAGEDNLAASVAGVEQTVVLVEIYCRRWAEWQNYDKKFNKFKSHRDGEAYI